MSAELCSLLSVFRQTSLSLLERREGRGGGGGCGVQLLVEESFSSVIRGEGLCCWLVCFLLPLPTPLLNDDDDPADCASSPSPPLFFIFIFLYKLQIDNGAIL